MKKFLLATAVMFAVPAAANAQSDWFSSTYKTFPGFYVGAHGGLTFSDSCAPDPDESREICHRPGPGEPDHVWWFGFDCTHAFDVVPAIIPHLEEARRSLGESKGLWPDAVYRNVEYVTQECRQLARQLKELA